jgi:hypothetical protein
MSDVAYFLSANAKKRGYIIKNTASYYNARSVRAVELLSIGYLEEKKS